MVRRRRDTVAIDDDCSSLSLRVATANVLTLHASDETLGHCLGACAETLASQFLAAGIHAVGPLLVIFHGLSCACWSGYAPWSRRCTALDPAIHPYSPKVLFELKQLICIFFILQGPLRVEAADLHILHATSRRIVVRWAHPGFRLLLLWSMHHPTTTRTNLNPFGMLQLLLFRPHIVDGTLLRRLMPIVVLAA